MKAFVSITAATLLGVAIGVLAVPPAASAMRQLLDQPCSSDSACIVGNNSGSGYGVEGRGASQSSGAHVAGSGGGVSGIGNVGVLGTGVIDGIKGTTSNKDLREQGAGVLGFDASKNPTNVGVLGASQVGAGVRGSSEGVGVRGDSRQGVGVSAESSTGTALSVESFDGVGVVLNAREIGKHTFMVAKKEGKPNPFSLDDDGNIKITGLIYAGGVACAATCNPRTAVASYGTTAAAPTIEDTGESRLRSGAAYVRLDPAFAGAIERQAGYIVLITPEADTRGLYVAQRGAQGFFVRETMGGRSEIPFAYRIVARPLGQNRPRLPSI